MEIDCIGCPVCHETSPWPLAKLVQCERERSPDSGHSNSRTTERERNTRSSNRLISTITFEKYQWMLRTNNALSLNSSCEKGVREMKSQPACEMSMTRMRTPEPRSSDESKKSAAATRSFEMKESPGGYVATKLMPLSDPFSKTNRMPYCEQSRRRWEFRPRRFELICPGLDTL
jgi:hypothetical protein